MGTIDFRSVGTTKTQRQIQTLTQSPTPIGIATPLKLGDSEGIFKMHFNLADVVEDNLRNLILTNWGERLGLYDFGANLRPLLANFVSQDDFDSQAVERIAGAVGKWMSYVSLETFESSIDRKENARSNGTAAVTLTVVYSVPSLQIRRKALEVMLYVM